MNLPQNLKNFIKTTPAKKCIIGISGGIDSALTLAIAVEAVGKENVLGVLMPYRIDEFSSSENYEDAHEICDFFGVQKKVHTLNSFAAPYEKIFPIGSMAFGNSLARIRMTILFGYANQENGIVLGTCNKSEVMLGYETKFGDGAADVNILGNLWKTEVWELSKKFKIPEKFITKSPSAELFPNQSDEEEMGFSYETADKILKKIETDQENFFPETPTEEKIFCMWKNSAHKRALIPTLNI